MGKPHNKKYDDEDAGEEETFEAENKNNENEKTDEEDAQEEDFDQEKNNEKNGDDENEEDDFQSSNGDEKFEIEKNGKKAGKKRAAKVSKSDSVVDSDDEPLNGGPTPAKKGRKAAATIPKAAAQKKTNKKASKSKAVVEEEEEDEENDEEEEEYEVQEIIDHKIQKGVSMFRIRWKGYAAADDTWESEDTLSCPDLIEKYKKKQPEKPEKKRDSSKSTAAVAAAGKKGRPKASIPKAKGKEDPNKEWEVDKIIDYAEEKDGRVFRIRWKGFASKHDTWEPEKNLCCDDIIEKFMSKMKAQENVSFKELREETKKPKRLVNETAPRTNITNRIERKTSKRSATKKRVYYGDSDE